MTYNAQNQPAGVLPKSQKAAEKESIILSLYIFTPKIVMVVKLCLSLYNHQCEKECHKMSLFPKLMMAKSVTLTLHYISLYNDAQDW